MSTFLRRSSILLAGVVAASFLAGCQQPPPPYVARPACHEVVCCNDNTGHKAGSEPWAMGGTCCCTPSDELMDQLHRDGQCVDMTAGQLLAAYVAKGVALREKGHDQCNGLCKAGPHVVLGGKCLCPPTPGTVYYERVISGDKGAAGGARSTGDGGRGSNKAGSFDKGK